MLIETPFLRTSFDESDVRGDGVVDGITLERQESAYLVTIALGEQFGEVKTPSRQPRNSLVLDLVRSRVPTRAAPSEVEVDLSPIEEEPDGEDGESGDETDEELDPDDMPNPDAEVINLDEGTHYKPEGPSFDPMAEPGDPEELRIITLDPGHGGSETGAKGQGGSLEKNVVLSISRRFQKLLEDRLGVRVILTRDGDRDLTLDERAAMANANKSNLFISIHADASPRRNARGSSVYFLTPNSADGNPTASSGAGELEFILWELAQTGHLRRSARLAEILQEELRSVTGAQRVNRGIKQNTFRVLKGAAMPAVLVEVGFISNADEERMLTTAEYQDQLAEALYRGVLRYKDLSEGGDRASRAGRGAR